MRMFARACCQVQLLPCVPQSTLLRQGCLRAHLGGFGGLELSASAHHVADVGRRAREGRRMTVPFTHRYAGVPAFRIYLHGCHFIVTCITAPIIMAIISLFCLSRVGNVFASSSSVRSSSCSFFFCCSSSFFFFLPLLPLCLPVRQ